MRPKKILFISWFLPLLLCGVCVPCALAGNVCSDTTIDQYLEQPVETTLGNTRVIYAAEPNFRQLTASSDRPLILLFYNNDQDFSKGLAAVAACVVSQNQQLLFIAYEIPELSQAELDRASLFTGGTIQAVPSLYLYRYTSDGPELAGVIQEGYRDKALVKKQILKVEEFVKNRLLR